MAERAWKKGRRCPSSDIENTIPLKLPEPHSLDKQKESETARGRSVINGVK